MSRTRRDVLASLAGVGVAGLAGCTAPDADESDSGDLTLDPAALREVMKLGSPASPARVPVPVADLFSEQGRGRTRELFGSYPETMFPEEVPNEAARNVYAEAYADATAALAPSNISELPSETPQGLRYACGAAAMAKGAYDVATGDLTEADVCDKAESVHTDIELFQRAIRYLGNDLDRVLVVYEAVENLVAGTARSLDNVDEYGRYADSAPRIGKLLDAIKSTRASLNGAHHACDRYLVSIVDPIGLTDAFVSTASSLGGVVEDRRVEYPEERGLEAIVTSEELGLKQFESMPVKDLLVKTFVEVERGLRDACGGLRNDRFATALVDAHTAETHHWVSEDIVTAVKRDRYRSAEFMTAVGDARLGTLEALEAARSDESDPHLTRRALVDTTHMVTHGDGYFRDDYCENGNPRAA